MISRPIVANVVHLQFAIALAAQRLCALLLHTSHDNPCFVTVWAENTLSNAQLRCHRATIKKTF